MVTRPTTPEAKTVAMLQSFETDYNSACKTKNPQILEQYFTSLSDDHLKQLCNSANIRALKRERRIPALAAALLERKPFVHKALQLMSVIVTGAGSILTLMCASSALKTDYNINDPATYIPFILFLYIFSLTANHLRKQYRQFGTTKASRRILRQMRALHTVHEPRKYEADANTNTELPAPHTRRVRRRLDESKQRTNKSSE